MGGSVSRVLCLLAVQKSADALRITTQILVARPLFLVAMPLPHPQKNTIIKNSAIWRGHSPKKNAVIARSVATWQSIPKYRQVIMRCNTQQTKTN